eukprot:761408-Hanusia_phi.AAC.3
MEQKRQAARITGVIDPVIEMIAKFSDKKDLETRISSLFHTLDVYEEGMLDYDKLNEGLLALQLSIPVQLSPASLRLLTAALPDPLGRTTSTST